MTLRIARLLACAAALAAFTAAPAAAARCTTAPALHSQPHCRTATNGATEASRSLTAYSLFRPDWPLNVNPATGARRWPIRNSLGQVFAWLEQRWDPRLRGINKTTAWIVYQPDGRTVFDQRRFTREAARDSAHTAYLAIQGYACMLDASYRRDPMVVLLHGDFGERGRYIGVRGFLDAQAIPSGRGAILNTASPDYRRIRGKSWPQVLATMHANTGCNQRALGFREPRAASPPAFGGNLLDAQFAWFYHYNGEFPGYRSTARAEPYGRGIRRILTNPAQNLYLNYATWPLPPLDAVAGNPSLTAEAPNAQAKIEASTTGIHQGGIVRAMVPVHDSYVVRDWFGYADPNGFCGRPSNVAFHTPARVAQWVLVSIPGTQLEGWVPRKVPNPRYDANGCGR
jgi:hypothetical protein